MAEIPIPNLEQFGSSQQELLKRAAGSVIYGPTVERYIVASMDARHPAETLSPGEIDSETVDQALRFLAASALRTEEEYDRRHPGVLQSASFHTAIREHQDHVDRGDIALIPEEFAMTPEEGQHQVDFADQQLARLGSRAQTYLAGLNYAAFTPSTMQTGLELLEGRNRTDLAAWSEKGIQDSMPHLAISNIAIGELVADIYGQTTHRNIPLQIIDNGSGSGATLAGIVLGLEKGIQSNGSVKPDQIGLTGIECTAPMFGQLQAFAEAAGRRLYYGSNGLMEMQTRMLTEPEAESIQPGELTVVFDDIAHATDTLMPSTENGLTVVTANYAWHRIPTEVKDKIVKVTTQRNENVIFLIADLVQNASEVNRRYFNFRDNGLLNPGNRHLLEIFAGNGLSFFELDEKRAPRSMDPRLARQIGQGVTSDSIFTAAYRGNLAREIVERWQN